MPLTDQKRRFVDAYLLEPNGTRAAITAGYSPKTAAAQASRLLKDVNVAKAIDEGQRRLSIRSGITPDMIMAELAKLGFSDIRQVVQWRAAVQQVAEDPDTGEPVLQVANEVVITDSAKLSDAAAAGILEVSQSKDGTLKVRMHDKLGALVKMGQHLGMFRPAPSPDAPGKKEIAQQGAHGAEQGTSWDGLLN
ncbi:terminase small subunit [Azospirillum agricola]|uniref:terminase small subunit n=1 Tax=Azospirillum agricola TaxID=1720247 RepID=UPI000A0F1853|nr:terminase small subunit [Azospirillum agricola]SMH30582.1 phage terminase small subunit [Azospirillum lipoferum]